MNGVTVFLPLVGFWSVLASPEKSPAGPALAEYRDERTGARVRNLTPDFPRAYTVYQTHPMWTARMKYLLFVGDYAGKPGPCALDMKTGRTQPLTEEPVGAFVLDSRRGRLYYTSGNDFRHIAIAPVFRGKAAPRRFAALPPGVLRMEGGISLDAKGDVLYAGAAVEENKQWALFALEIASASWKEVTELDFKVGHIQANPVLTRVLMFCHETGGDAPQRTWTVNADGTGLRPFYKETYNEWVTHEVWWGGTRAVFTVWPYDAEHTKKPHGVVSADLATGTPTVHAQFRAWHTHGSPDGQWIVADDFDRNLWLIKVATGERRLLTQGHLGKGFATHPHPSFTPDGKGVVFTSSRSGVESVFLVDLPAFESLPLP